MSKKQELYCYLRVSTQSQVDEGHSIENQRHLGKKISKKLNMTYVEMNEGGKSSMSVRPVFEELKEGIRIGRIKNIWYFSRSRWTRNTIEDLLMKKNYFVPHKTKVFEGEEGIQEITDPKDELLDTILTTVQQFDRQQRRQVSGVKRHLSLTMGQDGVFMGGILTLDI